MFLACPPLDVATRPEPYAGKRAKTTTPKKTIILLRENLICSQPLLNNVIKGATELLRVVIFVVRIYTYLRAKVVKYFTTKKGGIL